MSGMQERWWRAAAEGDGAAAREIVRGGHFHPGWRTGAEGDTPLTFAVKTENHEIAEHVCEAAGMPPDPGKAEIWRKAVLDARNLEGDSPLHIAAVMDFELGEGFIQGLMGAGADLDVPDSDGRNALEVASDSGNMDAVDLLSGMGDGNDARRQPPAPGASRRRDQRGVRLAAPEEGEEGKEGLTMRA